MQTAVPVKTGIKNSEEENPKCTKQITLNFTASLSCRSLFLDLNVILPDLFPEFVQQIIADVRVNIREIDQIHFSVFHNHECHTVPPRIRGDHAVQAADAAAG